MPRIVHNRDSPDDSFFNLPVSLKNLTSSAAEAGLQGFVFREIGNKSRSENPTVDILTNDAD